MSQRSIGVLGVLGIVGLAACGGSVAPGTGSASSVQNAGMAQSFAGQNKCDAKNHTRPFVIEWDATDMSSFEGRAANDVIFVHYEGCELTVLEGCVDGLRKGAFGAYRPVEWTSGSLESLDINNDADLHAKLPLGTASLGGRVQGGEKFHMEYFVSGTRNATRDAIYRADLATVASCKDATHFVYGYNLGAFAVGAQSSLKATVGGSAFGFGAGGDRSSLQKADKVGGVLTSCKGVSAKEVDTCKTPIRLTLRPITEGANPDATATQAPETDAALNLAGTLAVKMDQNDKAAGFYQTATDRFKAGDGKGCLAALDQRDKADPKAANLTTNPASPAAAIRAECVMLSGRCDAGRVQLRKAYQAMNNFPAEQIDPIVDTMAGNYCQGDLPPRDQLLAASHNLQAGSQTKKDATFCSKNYETVKRLSATVKPKDDDDHAIITAELGSMQSALAAQCFSRTGDCGSAYNAWNDQHTADKTSDAIRYSSFGRSTPKCQDWATKQAAQLPPPSATPVTSAPSTAAPQNPVSAAMQTLNTGKDAATCKQAYDTIKQAKSSSDAQTAAMAGSPGLPYAAARCYARIPDCATAWKAFQDIKQSLPAMANMSDANLRAMFASQNPACK